MKTVRHVASLADYITSVPGRETTVRVKITTYYGEDRAGHIQLLWRTPYLEFHTALEMAGRLREGNMTVSDLIERMSALGYQTEWHGEQALLAKTIADYGLVRYVA